MIFLNKMSIRKALEKQDEWAYEISSIEGAFKQDCRRLAQRSSRMTRRILLDISEESANFGCAILIIDGVKRLWIATSSFDSQRHWELLNPIMDNPFLTSATLCEVPNKSRYQTQILDFKGKAGVKGAYDRIVDTECKILNSIAVFLDNIPDIIDTRGDLFLYTNLEPCVSCEGVIEAFSKEFQNINLTVYFRRWAS